MDESNFRKGAFYLNEFSLRDCFLRLFGTRTLRISQSCAEKNVRKTFFSVAFVISVYKKDSNND